MRLPIVTGGRAGARFPAAAVLGLLLAVGVATAPASATDEPDLADLDIEDLFDLEVTSLSKKSQRLSESAAAIFVLSGDDIRRSGVRSIPEALRMVPGLHVARLSANRWAISARGFNSVFSDKMLVLVDGRSVYTPLFAGVYWDAVDTVLEDVDRIEVIRGPGGTLWGANAVNGVINVVTKTAKDTQGALVSGGAGNVDRFVSGRWGGSVGEGVAYRGYVKYFDNQEFEGADVATGELAANDESDQVRGGFRLDWTPTNRSTFTFQGEAFEGDAGATVNTTVGVLPLFTETETETSGAHLLGRLSHAFADGHDAAIQLYYDRTDRDDAMWEEWRNTVDVDLQHRFPAPMSSELVWGLGYRFTEDHVNAGIAGFDPDSRDENLYTGFLQGELPLLEDVLRLTAGTKVEYNDHTDVEWQPSLRAALVPTDRQTFWASFTRAVRTPSRSTDDLAINFGGPDLVRGNPDSESEKLLAYEAGYRIAPTDRIAIDVSAYFNDYDDLTTLELVSAVPPEIVFDNKMEGQGYGVEVFGSWRVLDWLELEAFYAYTELSLDLDDDSLANLPLPIGSEGIEDAAPENTAQVRTRLDLPRDFELDAALWWVDRVPTLDIDSYFRFDMRLGWRPVDAVELSVAAQNITDSQHEEWGSEFGYQGTAIPRTVYGAVTWRY